MSLNNLYLGGCSSSGFVYPPPGGIPAAAYFPVPGLGQVTKPPALSMLSPATSGKLTPKTATVPPLSQASPSNGLTPGGSSSAALSATRTSSFAAALRKLAHQAKDPQEEAAALAAAAKHSGSPLNSSSPRSATPKRAPPPLVYSGHNASLSSPPVVTIAPTQTLSLSNDGRQSNDRVPSAHSTASSYDHYSMKHDRDQRPHSSHSRDEDRASIKESVSLPQTPTRLVPPQPSTASSREDSIIRGFHPYRPEDDLRAAAAAAAALNPAFVLDPAYAYHPAFLQPHPYTHPALRFEDPLLLERYRLMQAASFLPFPPPGLVPHPGVHPLLSGARYPAELLHQYQYISPGAQGLDHRSPQVSSADRSKSEDERIRELEREREKEKREKEREREREREREAESAKREKQREVERDREKHHSDHGERRNILTVPSRYLNDRERDHHGEGRSHHHHSEASHSGKGGSISHGTPRDSESVRSSEGSHSKNHISSNSSHNHYHYKYDNHLLTKHHDRAPSESSHSSYHHRRDSLGDVDQSKGQPPPPLVSPQRSSSKGSGESAIFRPFEKDGPSNSTSATLNDRTSDMLSVPPLHLAGVGGDKCSSGPTTKSEKDSNGLYTQPSVRVFGSTHEATIINSNYINHRVERFDFKSLARECAGDSAKPILGADLNQNAADLSQNPSLQPPPLDPLPDAVSPVISRLDLKERRLREARASAGYNSDSEDEGDSDEEEDRKRERLTVVDSALPMDLEVTPGKLGLLDALGLSTLQKKKDLQCQLFRKRRRSMREPSVSPVEMEDGESCDIHPEKCTLPSPTIHPASLCLERDYQDKCQFMLGLGVMPLMPERRAELDAVRRACEDCKRRQLEKRRKRARRGQSSESQAENDVLVALGTGSNKRKFDELNQSQNALDHTIEPLRITLGQLQERHLAAAHQQQQKNHVHTKLGADGSRPVIFPDSQGRQLGREFAEQFHESVLQSTRQKELSQKSGHGSDGRLHLSGTTSVQSGDGSRPVFRWPGIEGVLESYLRHREEERMEAQVLLDRCRQLHAEKSELHKVAESLNHRMRVLHQELADRDAERQQTQSAIDNLKKCLRIYR